MGLLLLRPVILECYGLIMDRLRHVVSHSLLSREHELMHNCIVGITTVELYITPLLFSER